MSSLELKIPPPLVAVVAALIMWGIFLVTPLLQIPTSIRVSVALSIALIGGCVSLAGVTSFHQMKTTINPTKPGGASFLVIFGVFKITRNHVRWHHAGPDRLGNISFFTLGIARASCIRSLHKQVSNRTGRERARRVVWP